VTNLLGQVFEEYRLEASLGAGAVGETFRGVHLRTSAVAAIKVVHARLMGDPGAGQRFRQQLALIATVHDAHVLAIRSYGEQQRQYYVICDLMLGGSLRGLLQRRSQELPLWRGLEIMGQAAEGLAAWHAQRVWHGDIKPENLLLERPVAGAGSTPGALVVRVADAGLPRLTETGATVGGNAAFGSPLYLSPEQCRGVPVDARSDIYSLGVVLYETVTGFPPFQIKTLGDAVEKHLHTAPPAPRSVVPALPQSMDAVVLRCLAKRPEDRFDSASALARTIREVAHEVGVPVVPAVVLRADRPNIHLRDDRARDVRVADDRPKVVLRDEPVSRTPDGGAPPPIAPIRAVFRGAGEGLGPPVGELPGVAPRAGSMSPPQNPPASPANAPPDEMTSADLPALNVRRRPTNLEQRPSALPPDVAEQGAGAGPARRSRRITVAVEPEVLTLTPGVPAIVRVTLANAGHLVDHFPVTVEGVPDGWVEGPHKPAQLIPGARTTVPLKVLVPRACGQRAGEYQVTIRAHSRDKPEESSAVSGRWTVMPFAASSVALVPQRAQGWRRARFDATIVNDGNAPAEYTLSASDEEQKLRCAFVPAATTTLDPCGRATVTIAAEVPIRWIGTMQSRAFTVRAQRVASAGRPSPQEAPVSAQGQFVHRPIIPVWVPPLLALLAVCLVFLIRTRTALHLAITPPAAQVAIGSTVPLAAAVLDARNEVAPNHPIAWRSRDTTVATVTDSGVVTGRREGQTEINAVSGRMLTAVPVMVVAARVDAIVLSPKSMALKIGATAMVRAVTKDARGAVLARDVMWTSSDPTVATIGGNGRVTAKTAGSATITAMADNKTATADVTVAALAAGETPVGTDDCIGYDPAALRVVDEKAAGWGVSDGSRDIATLDNQTDARRTLALARAYKRHCYLGRGNTRPDRSDYIIEYWDGTSGLPATLDIEDCQRYDRASLRIQEVTGQGWMLTDGKQRLTMADAQADAKHAWDVALQNSQFCFIGRGNRRPNHRDYVVQYWKR